MKKENIFIDPFVMNDSEKQKIYNYLQHLCGSARKFLKDGVLIVSFPVVQEDVKFKSKKIKYEEYLDEDSNVDSHEFSFEEDFSHQFWTPGYKKNSCFGVFVEDGLKNGKTKFTGYELEKTSLGIQVYFCSYNISKTGDVSHWTLTDGKPISYEVWKINFPKLAFKYKINNL